MSCSEFSEQRHMLPKIESEAYLYSDKVERRQSLKSFALVALLSSVISILITVFSHHFLLSAASSASKQNETLLPELNIPRLGNFDSVFMPGQIYRQPPSNLSHDAWMSLFPKGKGYISTVELEKAGPLPDFLHDTPTDGSGRFCIAAFHQMHCLYLMQNELFEALEGKIDRPGPHTLHCVDYLRASIMCAADTTLEPFKSRLQGFSGGNSVDGFGTPHQCRNFDQLYEWAERFRYNDNTDADHFSG